MPNYEVSQLDPRTWLVFLGERHWYVTESNSGYFVQTPQSVIEIGTDAYMAVSDAVHAFRTA